MRRRAVERASALAAALAVAAGLGFVWFAASAPVSTVAGLSPLGDAAALALGGVALTALAIALSTSARLVVALLGVVPGAAAGPPAQPLDLAVVVTQSRPDASGRPLPRAPGRTLPAA